MNQKGKKRKLKNPMKQALLCMPILTILLSMLFAKLILEGMLSEEQVGTFGLCIAAVVSCVGGHLASRRAGERYLLWSVGTAAVYGCMLMLGNLLFFGVAYHAMGAIWVTVLLAGILAGILPYKKKGKIA